MWIIISRKKSASFICMVIAVAMFFIYYDNNSLEFRPFVFSMSYKLDTVADL